MDDVVAAADTTATLLALNGHEVTVAYDGGQAMAAAAWEPQVRRDAMSAGFDKFLTKPASLEVLETALRG